MKTYEIHYRPLYRMFQDFTHRIAVAFVIGSLVFGNVFFYYQSTQKDVEIVRLETILTMLERENEEVRAKLNSAIIPESTWKEFGDNRVVSPAKKAFNWVKGLFNGKEEVSG